MFRRSIFYHSPTVFPSHTETGHLDSFQYLKMTDLTAQFMLVIISKQLKNQLTPINSLLFFLVLLNLLFLENYSPIIFDSPCCAL
jgi:hypothetical protein